MLLTNERLSLSFNTETISFEPNVCYYSIARYLKGVLSKEEFNEYIDYLRLGASMSGDGCDSILDLLVKYFYDFAKPFEYKEVFLLEESFQALVFGTIDIAQMISDLTHRRISVEGITVKQEHISNGSIVESLIDLVYELHLVDCTKLGINEELPAVRCWCTSTGEVHWLWVEEEYAEKGPLEAIASTCRVYENMIPYITGIKRHGDVFLFEMEKEIIPEGELIPLTKDMYFKLLKAQS